MNGFVLIKALRSAADCFQQHLAVTMAWKANNRWGFFAAVFVHLLTLFLAFSHVHAKNENALIFDGVTDLEKIREQDLRTVISAFYQAEANSDWASAFNLRRNVFKDSISLSTFSRIMEEETDGWFLRSVRVHSSWEGNYEFFENNAIPVVFVRLLFIERTGSEYFMKEQLGKPIGQIGDEMDSIETTAWLVENGKWKCLQCGMRGHIFLNLPLVLE